VPVVPSGSLSYSALAGRRSADPMLDVAPTGCSVRVVRIDPGPRTPHVHRESVEIAYVAAGTGTAWEGDAHHPVAPGDLLVVPAGVPHATVATGDEPLVLVCFFPHPDLAANIEELAGPERGAGPEDLSAGRS